MWVLLIVLYTGDMNITYYPTAYSCETALIEKTDLGNRKHIKRAVCMSRDLGKLERRIK